MTTPPNKPEDQSPDRDSTNPGQADASPDAGGSSSSPPPGSKGYRKSSDPLPRGIPLSDGTRSGSTRRPLSYGPSGPAAAADTASSAASPKPARPQQPSQPSSPNQSDAASPVSQSSAAGGKPRPAQPTPNPHAKPNNPTIFASPKVPQRSTTATQNDATDKSAKPDVTAAATVASTAAASASASSTSTPTASPVDDDHDGAAPPLLPSQAGMPAPTDRRGLLLLVMLIISLSAHGLLAWRLYDKPLGEIDPQLISERQLQPVRIQRAPADLILPDPAADRAMNPSRQDETPPSPLPDLSLAMLQASREANPNSSPQEEIRPDPRPFEEAMPASPSPATPSTELPDQITRQMSLNIPLSTKYVAPDTNLQANVNPNAAITGGSGLDQAMALLSQETGLPGAGTPGGGSRASGNQLANPDAPAMPAPKLTDRADITDARAQPIDLMPQAIDLSGVTNNAASNLAIPEHLDNDFEYAVTRYIPKGGWGVSEEDERGYFRVDITAKRSLRKLQTMPKDLVILIDTSESVPQHWIDHTLRGVRDSLASLNPDDRFNLVYFNDNPAILGEDGILPVNEENLAKAREFLSEARSGGMTDVNQALSRLLVRDVAMDRSYEIILISDGRPTRGVMDTRELLNLITRDNDLAASIYCLGVGRAQNRTLLEFLAYRNKGYCVFVDDPFQASIAVRELVSRLRYPILKDVKLTVMGLNTEEVFPVDLPTIHQGETFSIFGRFDNPGKNFTMRLLGHNGKNRYDFTFTRDLSQAPVGEEEISRDWGFWKLHHLYNQMLRQGDTRELRQQIEYLRRKYKLRTLYQ